MNVVVLTCYDGESYMSNKFKEEKYRESAFIGEISSPVLLDDKMGGMDFTLHSLNDISLELGAAEFITRSGAVYHGVIRAILKQQKPGSAINRDREKERHVVVDGLTFTQAAQIHHVIQNQEPKMLRIYWRSQEFVPFTHHYTRLCWTPYISFATA